MAGSQQNHVQHAICNSQVAEEYHSFSQPRCAYGKFWTPERAELENKLCAIVWNRKVQKEEKKKAERIARRHGSAAMGGRPSREDVTMTESPAAMVAAEHMEMNVCQH